MTWKKQWDFGNNIFIKIYISELRFWLDTQTFHLKKLKICDWICKNQSYHPWQEAQIFGTDTKIHNTLSSFTKKMRQQVSGSAGCFSPTHWRSIIPYEQSWSLVEHWWTGRELCVTVQLWMKTFAVFNNHFG